MLQEIGTFTVSMTSAAVEANAILTAMPYTLPGAALWYTVRHGRCVARRSSTTRWQGVKSTLCPA